MQPLYGLGGKALGFGASGLGLGFGVYGLGFREPEVF